MPPANSLPVEVIRYFNSPNHLDPNLRLVEKRRSILYAALGAVFPLLISQYLLEPSGAGKFTFNEEAAEVKSTIKIMALKDLALAT